MKITDEEIKEALQELNASKFEARFQFELTGLQLLAVHGSCCLALRHPDFNGPSRSLVLKFTEKAEEIMVREGLMPRHHLEIIHAVEAEETEHNRRPS